MKHLLNSSDNKNKRYIIITCAVFNREVFLCAAKSKNIIEVISLDQGLHDIGEVGMSAKLQETIDDIDAEKYDAVLMGYGLCNNGIRGLHASIPLVIPRAHDCIALLMGSKEQYREYFDANPGTFYRSVGWVEQVEHHLSNPDSTTTQMGMEEYDDYVEKYGEDNAKYLIEMFEGGLKHYTKLTYINTGVGDFQEYKDVEKADAEKRGWEFEEYEGDTNLFTRLMNGDWDDNDFLVIQPGEKIKPTYDDQIIGSE